MKNKKYLIVIAILAIVLVLGSIYFVGHDQREKGTFILRNQMHRILNTQNYIT